MSASLGRSCKWPFRAAKLLDCLFLNVAAVLCLSAHLVKVFFSCAFVLYYTKPSCWVFCILHRGFCHLHFVIQAFLGWGPWCKVA